MKPWKKWIQILIYRATVYWQTAKSGLSAFIAFTLQTLHQYWEDKYDDNADGDQVDPECMEILDTQIIELSNGILLLRYV